MKPQLWFLNVDAPELDSLLRCLQIQRVDVSNLFDMPWMEHLHQDAAGVFIGKDVPVAADFPAPRLAPPKRGFAPDDFTFGGPCLCSRRFRDACAQPASRARWADVDVTYDGPATLPQDYKQLSVLAHQPAMKRDTHLH